MSHCAQTLLGWQTSNCRHPSQLAVPYDEVKIPLTGELKKAESSGECSAAWKGKTLADLVAIKEDYKKNINAAGEVPTLQIGDDIVTESDVVSEFLDDAFPESGTRLLPKDPIQRARLG